MKKIENYGIATYFLDSASFCHPDSLTLQAIIF